MNLKKGMKSLAKLLLLAIFLGTSQSRKRYRCTTKVPYFFTEHQISSKIAHQRIVGGEKVPSMIPWQVSLMFEYFGKKYHYCGGIILDEKTILTAAHCQVRIGELVLAGQVHLAGKTIEVDSVVKNPYKPYNDTTMENDVLILKLKEPLEFSDKIQPACLPKKRFFPPTMKMDENGLLTKNGTICYASGWGTKQFGGSSPMTLQYAGIPLLSKRICKILYSNITAITHNMICAGAIGGGIDSCQGDSGGPLVCIYQDKPIITGVVSFGVGCGVAWYPGVYARVTSYLRWIKAQMEFSKYI